MERSRLLIQLDGAAIVGDSSRKSSVDVLHRSEVVPCHSIFLFQLDRALKISSCRCSVAEIQLRYAELVHQFNLITAPAQRVNIVTKTRSGFSYTSATG